MTIVPRPREGHGHRHDPGREGEIPGITGSEAGADRATSTTHAIIVEQEPELTMEALEEARSRPWGASDRINDCTCSGTRPPAPSATSRR